jgi:hypothetical protein
MGVGSQCHTPAALPTGTIRYPLYRRLGGPRGQSGQVRNISPPPGFDPQTVQPVASCYTDWAIPAHWAVIILSKSVVAILLTVYTLHWWQHISIVTIRHGHSTSTTHLSVHTTNNTRTTIQIRAQQLIIKTVTWDSFYLILICLNTAYQCDNFMF